FVIDNTAPTLTVSATGFFVRTVAGVEQWWSGVATPVLTGTVTDANLADITIRVGAIVLGTATVVGSDWTFTIPAGQANHAGAALDISATDQAGNGATLTRRIYADTTPPQLSAAATTVLDERQDTIVFPAGNVNAYPQHTHSTNNPTRLGEGGCPTVYKHATLLQGAVADNPIRFDVGAADEPTGIGLNPMAQVRVNINGTPGTFRTITGAVGGFATLALPLTIANAPASNTHQPVPGLATVEGMYEVEWRVSDLLGRVVTVTHCFDNQPLAPPLEAQAPYVPGSELTVPTHVHALRAAGFTGTSNRVLAASLLSGTPATPAPGLSVMDFIVKNHNEMPVHLTVTPTMPDTLTGTRKYVLQRAIVSETTSNGNCITTPSACAAPVLPGVVLLQAGPLSGTFTPTWGVRAINTVTSAELPCTVCGVGGQWRFQIPARSGFPLLGNPVQVRIMTVMTSATGLWPTGGDLGGGLVDMSMPPYVDTTFVYNNGSSLADITGQIYPEVTGCTKTATIAGVLRCTRVSTLRPYRALAQISLSSFSPKNTLLSAPSATGTPRSANSLPDKTFDIPAYTWPLENTLPTPPLGW
nr:hypothetical protein [Gemmatimonadales bacterium]